MPGLVFYPALVFLFGKALLPVDLALGKSFVQEVGITAALEVQGGVIALEVLTVEKVEAQPGNAFRGCDVAEGEIDQLEGGEVRLGEQGAHQQVDVCRGTGLP